MSRWIDADALEYDTEWSEYHDGFTAYSQMAIDTAPSIDIVRCKECKYKRIYDDETKYYYCALEVRPNRQWSVDETDYCSWGEREGE